MFVVNYVFVYGFGLIQLNLWMSMVKGTGVSFSQLLTMGLLPFIPGELIKVPAAALAAWALTPK
jgi:biotin transport system substrate-specific component